MVQIITNCCISQNDIIISHNQMSSPKRLFYFIGFTAMKIYMSETEIRTTNERKRNVSGYEPNQGRLDDALFV